MATTNTTKVVPYILVVPTPPPRPPPRSTPSPAIMLEEKDDDNNNNKNRKRNNASCLSLSNCACLPAFLAGFAVAALLCVAIAVPVMVILATSNNEASTSVSTSDTTTTLSTTTSVTTSTTTTTVTVTTSSTSTSTTATTDIPCSPSCNSQKTCVQGVCVGIGYLSMTLTWSRSGDGDIVVATPNNNIICYTNKGATSATDFGRLDVDVTTGTGPENVFWANNGTLPPNGTYYVCFSQYSFITNANPTYPIVATVRVVRSASTTLTFTRNFTSYYVNSTVCDSTSGNLLGSFSYP